MSTGKIPTPPTEAVTDERQPLLGSSGQLASPALDEENGENLVLGAKPSAEERGWKTITAYVVLGIVGTVLLGFFIKGFLDADDVEVCLTDMFLRSHDVDGTP